MLEISNNSMSIARGCWKKYYWTYVEGLRPKTKTDQLTLGEIVHKAFELFYTGTSDKDVLSYIEKRYDEEIAKAFVDDQESLITSKYTALGMWAGYPHKNPAEFSENHVEAEFKIKLPNIKGVRLVGRADGIVLKDGVWWVREVKTTGLTPRQFEGRIKNSSQVTGYVIAAKQKGYPVAGVMYEAIKKPLLRKGANESVDQFGKRIVQDYIADGLAPESQRKYYSRPKTYRNDDDITRYLNDTKMLVREMRSHIRRNEWERNTDQCWNFNTECPFSKICFQDPPDRITMEAYFDRRTR